MRTIEETDDAFHGTHKGAEIFIEQENDGRFYIEVRWSSGSYMYDGWAPDTVITMKQAKAEAIRGAQL